MRLCIISDMSHYRRGQEIVGWGPTVQEIDHLATLFDRVDHVACLHDGPAPGSSLPYRSGSVNLTAVRPAGGRTFKDKLNVLKSFPAYTKNILCQLKNADVVHVRCPANISLLALIILSLRKFPERRWIKYAGEWERKGVEPASYTLQRWWLKSGLVRGCVTVNGEFPGQPRHVHPFFNPCLDNEDLREASRLAGQQASLRPLRVLFVGNLDPNKGVLRALEIVRLARDMGVDARLEVVGDGQERATLEHRIKSTDLGGIVTLHGWLTRPQIAPVYARNHILLMTSQTEGWPKVLSEGMAYGVVPIASAISCIPHYLSRFRVGRTLPWQDVAAFASSCSEYFHAPRIWLAERERAMAAAHHFSYQNYLSHVAKLLNLEDENSASVRSH